MIAATVAGVAAGSGLTAATVLAIAGSEMFADVQSIATLFVALLCLAGAISGLTQRTRVQNLEALSSDQERTIRFLRDENTTCTQRLDDLESKVADRDATIATLTSVVTGEAHLVVIEGKVDKLTADLDSHHDAVMALLERGVRAMERLGTTRPDTGTPGT